MSSASSTSAAWSKRVSCERKAAVDAATASRRCGDGGAEGGVDGDLSVA